MELRRLIDSNRTDKDTTHSYLETYEELFNKKRLTSRAILEIGIANGGSIKLWNDYFVNAIIYGLDIMDMRDSLKDIINHYSRIKLKINVDAYNMDLDEFKQKFDIIIEDGDHSLPNQVKFINKYLPLLDDNGIMIIEDIQDINDINILTKNTPDEYKKYIEVYDLRKNKNRYDDIVFTIDKSL